MCVYVFYWLLLLVFLSLGSGLNDANGFLRLCVRTSDSSDTIMWPLGLIPKSQ